MKLATRFFATLICVLMISATTQVQADLVAYWNYNGISATGNMAPGVEVPVNIFADAGADAGAITDLSGWGGNVNTFDGTTLNNLFGDVAGNTLSVVGNTGNGTFVDYVIDMTGFVDPVVTFAARGTFSGFATGTWSWSSDGSTFNAIAGNTGTTSATFSTMTADFTGEGIQNLSDVTLRYTLTGATAGTGNNRIDNLQINARVIPEPGTLGLAGLALVGLGVCRRRR